MARSPSTQPPPFDDEMLELINEYFYGVRIFPGQDPNMVYVGWVTTQYHLHTGDFNRDCVRNVTVQKLDNYGGIQERQVPVDAVFLEHILFNNHLIL